MVVTCGSRRRGDGVVALASQRWRGGSRVASGAIEALQKQLFSRQLPEARSGSKINWRGARYRSEETRASRGAAFRAPRGTLMRFF